MTTADTITDEQIRELRAAFPMAMEDEFAVEYACGERGPIGERLMRESKQRCAAIYNSRCCERDHNFDGDCDRHPRRRW